MVTVLRRRRAASLLIVWLLAAGTTTVLAARPGVSTTHSRTTHQSRLAAYDLPQDPAHPYSAPVWWPLGAPATSDCYRDNPGCNGYHGYWALDIDSLNRGLEEPVYPLGAGQVHYGATGVTCNGTQGRGNWVWVDHGGGVVSNYGHLGSITVPDGAWVTPHDQIGTVGNSGYTHCAENTFRYLYVAVRRGGWAGPYVEARSLYACVNGARQTWPSALPGHYPTFNDIPQSRIIADNLHIPGTTRSCIPTSVATPTQPAAPTVARPGSQTLQIAAPPRSTQSVSSVMIETQRYVAASGTWMYPTYQQVAPGTPVTLSGLANGRTYRIRTSLGNSAGWSAPSAWRTVVPAGVPGKATVRYLEVFRTVLHFGWYRNDSNGDPITHFQVAIRRYGSSGWTPWTYTMLTADPIHYNWYNLRPNTRYEVATHAINGIGSGPWSYRVVITPR